MAPYPRSRCRDRPLVQAVSEVILNGGRRVGGGGPLARETASPAGGASDRSSAPGVEPLRRLAPSDRERIFTEARLQAVTWDGVAEEGPGPTLDRRPVIFALEGERLPLIFEAISVAEIFHRRLMGVARRRFGADALPPRLTGRTLAGEPLRDDHTHIHILPLPAEDQTISHLVLWTPTGFTAAERAAIEATALPELLGAPIFLRPVAGHPALGPARVWRSITPFLPGRHWKRRGARWVDTVEDQVVRELEERGLPRPVTVRRIDGPWTSFRIVRLAKPGCKPSLGAHGVRVEFDQNVRGPLALGRNSHFGMGTLTPS